jgi:PAS domain S-box-containing protein
LLLVPHGATVTQGNVVEIEPLGSLPRAIRLVVSSRLTIVCVSQQENTFSLMRTLATTGARSRTSGRGVPKMMAPTGIVPGCCDALVQSLGAAADGSFVSDAAGNIVLWNPAAEALLGYTASDVLGGQCCSLFCQQGDGGGVTIGGACPLAASHTRGSALQTTTKAGSVVWFDIFAFTIDHARIGARFVVHLFREITLAPAQLPLAPEARMNSTVTPREREVLGLMCDGLDTTAIAQRLNVSYSTIRNHVQNILRKLEVHSRLQAVAHARQHRLV